MTTSRFAAQHITAEQVALHQQGVPSTSHNHLITALTITHCKAAVTSTARASPLGEATYCMACPKFLCITRKEAKVSRPQGKLKYLAAYVYTIGK